MSQYFIDKLVYNNDTLDIHDTGAREMINTNTTNIQALSARVTQNANDIDALEETTADLREDLDNVEDRVTVTEGEIDGLKTRTTSLEGRMATAENRLDGHDDDIEDLQDRMDTAENNIIALDGRMTAAENDIDAAEHRLDLVEAKNDEQDIAIDDLEENVAQNTADIVDIKDDLTGIHEDIEDLDDRITASTYEAGIGIYFGQGVEHTNINVEDEILDQINQNTIDIQNLKTRVTNVENRLTVVEGDITDIKAEIVNIKADITLLKNRVTALENKALPAGGTTGQMLVKKSNTNYDVEWVNPPKVVQRRWTSSNISEYTAPDAEGVWTDYFDKSCFTVSGAHLRAVPFCNTNAADKNLNWIVRTNYMSYAGWDKTAYGFGGNISVTGNTTGVETAIMFGSRELTTDSYTKWNYVSGGIMVGILSAKNKAFTHFDEHDFIKTIMVADESLGLYSSIYNPGSILKLYYYITVSGYTAYEVGEMLVSGFGLYGNKFVGSATTNDFDNNAYFVKLVMENVNNAITNTITTVNLGALT